MEQESFEEFLTPITPTKSQLNVISTAPDSPSKAQARNRLGNLLGQIRKGDSSREGADQRAENADFYDEDVVGGRRGPGRPKKIRREKRVVFELRGKPFGLRDSGKPESIYALCRKWMYGKDDAADDESEALDEQPEFDVPRFKSLDLMATRDIHVLPQARPEIPLMDPRPPRVICPASVGADKVKDGGEQLLREYKHHWKDVKKNWMGHNRKRQQRYTDSLQLLRTVYGIAQQAHP